MTRTRSPSQLPETVSQTVAMRHLVETYCDTEMAINSLSSRFSICPSYGACTHNLIAVERNKPKINKESSFANNSASSA